MAPGRSVDPRLVKVALALLSAGLALLAVELWLRATVPIEDLYTRLANYPKLASDGWARAFLRDYADYRKRGDIGNDLGGFVHDPLLGWDVPRHVRAVHGPSEGVPLSLRVLTIGDSFTYGSEVEADRTFSAYLAELLPGSQVTNMGVRAYGVGQMALKLTTYGRDVPADVIVLSVFGPDYVRTPLTFYRFAMPSVQLAKSGRHIEVQNVPVPPPDQVYDRLRVDTPLLLYSYALLRQSFLNSTFWLDLTGHDERFYCRYDVVHELLLRSAKDFARKRGAQLLLVYIPSAWELKAENAFLTAPSRANLLRIFAHVGAPYLDLADALLKRHERPAVHADLYFHKDGREGHFTPDGNRAVAEILRDEIVKLRAGKSAAASSVQTPAPPPRGPC